MESPQTRSLRLLRNNGWIAETVERIIRPPRGRIIRQDLYGFGDILATHPCRHGSLIVQATSTSNVQARIKKSQALDKLETWLGAGNRFAVIGWSKRGPRGKRKLWTPRIILVTVDSVMELDSLEDVPTHCSFRKNPV